MSPACFHGRQGDIWGRAKLLAGYGFAFAGLGALLTIRRDVT